MAIQLNFLNPQGLATLAGQNVGNMNLPVVGLQPGLFQQSMVEAANKKDQLNLQNQQLQQQLVIAKLKEQGMSERDAMKALNEFNLQQYRDAASMDRTQVQEQGQMQRQQMQSQLGYDQLNSLNQDRAARLGLDTARFNADQVKNAQSFQIDQKKQALEEYKVQLQQQMQLGEQKVKERASLMASIVKNAPPTDDAGALDAYYRQAMAYAVKKGSFTPEEAEQFINIPSNMKKTVADASISMSQTALNYLKDDKSSISKAIQEANAAKIAAGQQPFSKEEEAQLISQYALQLPNKNVQGSNLQEELNKKYAAQADTAAQTRSSIQDFKRFNQEAQELLKSVPGYALGPLANAVKLDKLDPRAQQLESVLNAATLIAKDAIVKLKGSTQGFTDQERQFVQSVSGGTFQNKYSLQQILEFNAKIADKLELAAWEKENSITKRGNSADYQQWLQDNPKPSGAQQQYSQEDLEYTAKKHNISIDELKKKLETK